MKLIRFTPAIVLVLIVVALSTGLVARATYANEELSNKKAEIKELEEKLDAIQNEKFTISRTINYLTTKIRLTESQMAQTQDEISALAEEITSLAGKIDVLNISLEKLSIILVNRINASYKQSFTKPVYLLLTSDGFSDFFKRYKYLQVSQKNDRDVMLALEKARTDYDTQKSAKETKQEQMKILEQKLKAQEASLEQQQTEKEAALRITKNNELKFQAQLATARSELEAIQSIIAGKGDETEVGSIGKGNTIASIIPTASTCSNGPHLHFEVAKNGNHVNPVGFLSTTSVIWDNAPDAPFGFSGSWPWPISDPIRITQGYGMTFYASTLRYYGGAPHTGIDMMSKSSTTITSVEDGTLYRGAIACGRGTLRYVRVEHADNVSSYYLHVNY